MAGNYIIKIYVDEEAKNVTPDLIEKLTEAFQSLAELFTEEGYVAAECTLESVESVDDEIKSQEV